MTTLDEDRHEEVRISLRALTKVVDLEKLQRVLVEAPRYFINVSGALPSAKEAKSLFEALPPNSSPDAKFVLGLELRIAPQDKNSQQGSDSAEPQTLIGCIDVLIGYPAQETAMLGLLIISELHQSKGYGREALALLEHHLRQYPQIQKIRIGVVETNSEVLSFWKKQGYADTGERKPYVNGDVRSEVLVLEKFLRRN